MVAVLESSYDQGLLPEDYHLEKIKGLMDNIEDGVDNNIILENLDLFLSDAMIIYAQNPKWGYA